MKAKTLFYFLLLALFIPLAARTQNHPADTTLLMTSRGDVLKGFIVHTFKDTLVFQLNTGDYLAFNQREIVKVRRLKQHDRHRREGVPCGNFELSFESREPVVGDQIKISGNFGLMKTKGLWPYRFRANRIEWLEFWEGDCWQYSRNEYKIETDSATYIGQLRLVEPNFVTITKSGLQQKVLPFKEVRKIKYVPAKLPEFDHRDYLFMGSTGFNLKKNQSMFRSLLFFQYSYTYGLSKHFSANVALTKKELGGISYSPSIGLKGAYSIEDRVHLSGTYNKYLNNGWDWQLALSLGVPDYYVNGGLRQANNVSIDNYRDVDAFFLGSSFRIARHSKLFLEYVSSYLEGEFISRTKRNFSVLGYRFLYKKAAFDLTYMIVHREQVELVEIGRNAYYARFYLDTHTRWGLSFKFILRDRK